MFVVMQLVKEATLNLSKIKVDLVGTNIGLCGMLPVYETKEDALKMYPNCDLVEINFKE